MAMPAKPEYDFPTAVTFFLAGLGVGAILALAFSVQVKTLPMHPPQVERSNAYSPAL